MHAWRSRTPTKSELFILTRSSVARRQRKSDQTLIERPVSGVPVDWMTDFFGSEAVIEFLVSPLFPTQTPYARCLQCKPLLTSGCRTVVF